MAPRHRSLENLNPGKWSSLLKARLTEMPAERAFGTGPGVDRSVSFMANFAKHLAYRAGEVRGCTWSPFRVTVDPWAGNTLTERLICE